MIETLEAVHQDIDARLARAAGDRHSPMHTPVVATLDADLRVMVMRGWNPELATARLHTDARSPKVNAIGDGAAVGLLFYDPEARIQLRVRGQARIEVDGPVADAAWAKANNYARRCYLATGAPGSTLSHPGSGLPEEFEGVKPTDADLDPARRNFAVLLVEVEKFDWLHLAHDGHRRAILDATGSRWIIP